MDAESSEAMVEPMRLGHDRWHFVTALFAIGLCTAKGSRITTLNGDIEGFTETVNGITVDIYHGIPFAKPPLGNLRFREPQPMDNWSEVRDAKTQPNSCMQQLDESFGGFEGVDMWNTKTNISEDCLYLNLWVPRVPGANKLTTMFWIFGGSFVYGSITLDVYDGRFLAARKSVIVASVQYRMGVQGFLYSGTKGAPGNMGLLDQQMGMKWVHDNIESFGGDKNKITIFGESAGSGSVNHHLLAPSSWPYFNNAIMQSGTSYSFWAIDSPDSMLKRLAQLGKELNCDNVTLDEVVQCLRKVDAQTLEKAQWIGNTKTVGTFSPTVDGVFLPNYPATLVSNGRIKKADILLGVTKDEGEYFALYTYPKLFEGPMNWTPKRNLDRSIYIDTMAHIYSTPSPLGVEAMLYTYEYSVLPAKRGSYLDIIDDAMGDLYFKCPIHKMATEHAKLGTKGNTYVYSFNYEHSASPWPQWTGVMHADEIELVFGHPFNNAKNYSQLDRNVSDNVMEYFTQFAKNGTMGKYADIWPQFTADLEEHLVFLPNGSSQIQHGFRTKECAFWDRLAPEINKQHQIGLPLTSTSPDFTTNTDCILLCALLITQIINF